MAPPLRVRLDHTAKAELDRRYQTTRDATSRTRYQMVLLRAEGHPVVEVAQLTRCSPDTVRRVLKRYLAHGPDAVPHRPHLGQPPHYPPAWEQELPGWPTWTRARSEWTARCGRVGCWPTTWPR
jgi:transposase